MKTFAITASSVWKVLEKTDPQLPGHSSGKISRFIENLQKPQNFSLTQLLLFMVASLLLVAILSQLDVIILYRILLIVSHYY